MQTLYGGKTLTLHLKLSTYIKKPLELKIINLGIVTQVYFLKKVVFRNLKIKFYLIIQYL